MTHWGVYWKFFGRDDESWPVDYWLIGAGSRLVRAEAGDRLWLFTSGKLCREPSEGVAHLGYLVQAFEVDHLSQFTEDERFAWKVHGRPQRCVAIRPPLNVDDLIRPKGSEPETPIGYLWQGARKLAGDLVDALLAGLQAERTLAYQRLRT